MEVQHYRECALAQIRIVNGKLTPLANEWDTTPPKDPHAGKLDFPLIYFYQSPWSTPMESSIGNSPYVPPLWEHSDIVMS